MKTKERISNILNFKEVDRLPIIEWAPWWDLTIDEWIKQGLPTELDPRVVGDSVKLQQHFGLDVTVQEWFSPRSKSCPVPKEHGGSLVSNLEEYEEFITKGYLYNLNETLELKNYDRYSLEESAGDAAFWLTLDGFFWYPRTLFGIEDHLYSFYDEEELHKRMNQDAVDYYIKLIGKIVERHQPMFMSFAEDLSYNHGPMISEELFDEFMLPYYEQLIPVLKQNNIKVFIDSDGDISSCIDWFKRAGIDGIFPLERMAKVDVNQLRADHKEFLLMGGFDKTVMHLGEQRIRQEFERLLPVMQGGGFLVSCDHQTPPAVSIEDYQLYLKLFREYASRG